MQVKKIKSQFLSRADKISTDQEGQSFWRMILINKIGQIKATYIYEWVEFSVAPLIWRGLLGLGGVCALVSVTLVFKALFTGDQKSNISSSFSSDL